MFFSGSTHRSGPGAKASAQAGSTVLKSFLGWRAAGLEGSREETEAQPEIESESLKRASGSPTLSFDLHVCSSASRLCLCGSRV